MTDAIEQLHKLWEDAAMTALDNSRRANGTEQQKNTTNEGGVKQQARELQRKDPTKLKEADLVKLLEYSKNKLLADGSYIPVRINTPQILIAFAKEQGYTLDNHPIAMRVYKARQAMANVAEWDGNFKDTPHNLTPKEIVEIIRAMDNPTYLVFQSRNERFSEIVKFNKGKEKAYAIIDFFDVNKNAEIMNGYKGGKYNILVTVYPADDADNLKAYLKNKENKVITSEEIKKKGLSQRGLGSYVPAHLNDSPFFNDSIPQTSRNSQEKNSLRDPAFVSEHKQKQLEIIQQTNPMWDDYHTGIRTVADIHTWAEVLELNDEREGQFVWGDFSRADAEQALKDGTITVYSSHPIKNGVFVSTSYIQAQEYAGGRNGKVYSKTIPLSDVAWINGDEGQYAKIEKSNDNSNDTPSGQYSLGSPIQQMRYNSEAAEYTNKSFHETNAENIDIFDISRDEHIGANNGVSSEINNVGRSIESPKLLNFNICEYITKMCKKLGISVVFEDLRETYHKGEMISPDGYVNDGVIHLNFYAKNPIGFVLKHELTHYCEKTRARYNEFAKAVMKSRVFDKWLQKKTGKQYLWEAMEVYKEKVLESDPSIANINDEIIMREIIADFVGEMLFADNGSGMLTLLNDVEIKHRSTIVQYIVDFISWIKKKLSGQKFITLQLSILEDNFSRMLTETVQSQENNIYQESDGNAYCFVRCFDESIIAQAEQMENDGAKQYDIWNKLGIIRDAFGLWIYEVSTFYMGFFPNGNGATNSHKDNPLVVENNGIIRGKLKDFLRYKNLYKIYPRLQYIDVEIRYATNDYDTVLYLPQSKKIVIDKKLVDNFVSGTDYSVKSHLLREVQKIVQETEGRRIDPQLKNLERIDNGDLPFSIRDNKFLTKAELSKRFADDVETKTVEKREILRNEGKQSHKRSLEQTSKMVAYAPYINYDDVYVFDKNGRPITARENDILQGKHSFDAYSPIQYAWKTNPDPNIIDEGQTHMAIEEIRNSPEKEYEHGYKDDPNVQREQSEQNTKNLILYTTESTFQNRRKIPRASSDIKAGNSGVFDAPTDLITIIKYFKNNFQKELSGYDSAGRELSDAAQSDFSNCIFKDGDGNLLSFFLWHTRLINIHNAIKEGIDFTDLNSVLEIFLAGKQKNPSGYNGFFQEFYINSSNPLILNTDKWNTVRIAKMLLDDSVITQSSYDKLLSMASINNDTYTSTAAQRLREHIKLKGYDSIVFIKESGKGSVCPLYENQIIPVANNGVLLEYNSIKVDEDAGNQNTKIVDVIINPHSREPRNFAEIKKTLSSIDNNIEKLRYLTEMLMIANRPVLENEEKIRVGSSAFFEKGIVDANRAYALYKYIMSNRNLFVSQFDLASRKIGDRSRKLLSQSVLKTLDGTPISVFIWKKYANRQLKYADFTLSLGTLASAREKELRYMKDNPYASGGVYEEYLPIVKNPYFLMYEIVNITPKELVKRLFKDEVITYRQYLNVIERAGAESTSVSSVSSKYLKKLLLKKGIDGIIYMDGTYDPGSLAVMVFEESQLIPVSKNGIAVNNDLTLADSKESAFLLPENESKNFVENNKEKWIDSCEYNGYNGTVKRDGLNQSEKIKLKQKTGWTDGIVDYIRSMEEAQIYIDANLKETEINGRKCLIRSDIDIDQVVTVDALTNRELIMQNESPINIHGEKIELHHIGQKSDGPLAELTVSEHRQNGNYAILHNNKKRSEIDRIKFNSKRIKHWKIRFNIGGY